MQVGVVSMFVILGVVLMDIIGCGVWFVCMSCGLSTLPLDDTVLSLLLYTLIVTGAALCSLSLGLPCWSWDAGV